VVHPATCDECLGRCLEIRRDMIRNTSARVQYEYKYVYKYDNSAEESTTPQREQDHGIKLTGAHRCPPVIRGCGKYLHCR
jgi:hypothetical protein